MTDKLLSNMLANKQTIQFNSSVSKYFYANYRPLLPVAKNISVLDFGCGQGNVLNFLVGMGYQNINGVDIESFPEWQSTNLANVNTLKMDDVSAYLNTIEEKQYDFIIIKDVIYYFSPENVVNAVMLLKKALKPGGKMLFDIFNGSTLTGPFIHHKDLDIKLILTEHSLKTIIERAGMRIELIQGNKIPITGLGSMVYRFSNAIQRLRLKLLFFAERGIDGQNPTIFSKKILALAVV